ncbi:MAG: phosphoglycolate phosphatase [Methanotrichaceae archaeon]|nr:phosphoglycolate phosphatase [Methanotrichaceae archaeon]
MALDIDGTLTDDKRRLCPASIKAIQSLRVPVVLVTGNTHCFTRTMAIALGTPFVFIAENGGVVSHSDNEMEILADINICERAYSELSRIIKLHRHDSRYRFTDITLRRDFDIQAASRLLKDLQLKVELIDTAFAVHIKDLGVNKGTGLERIAKRLQIPLKEFAAVGDSKSDVPIFNLAGFRASVGNASPELKSISDYIARYDYGLGFMEIVNHMNKHGIFQ